MTHHSSRRCKIPIDDHPEQRARDEAISPLCIDVLEGWLKHNLLLTQAPSDERPYLITAPLEHFPSAGRGAAAAEKGGQTVEDLSDRIV